MSYVTFRQKDRPGVIHIQGFLTSLYLSTLAIRVSHMNNSATVITLIIKFKLLVYRKSLVQLILDSTKYYGPSSLTLCIIP